MEKNGVIETRTERRTVITRDGDNIDHDKVSIQLFIISYCVPFFTYLQFLHFCNFV